MERECWQAIAKVPEEMSIGELQGLLVDLNSRPCLYVYTNIQERQVVLLLEEPKTLRDAPSGTHEFARGWLAHADAALAAKYLKPLEWKPIKKYDNGRIILDTSTIRSGFKV